MTVRPLHLSVFLLCAAAFFLMGLEERAMGWVILLSGATSLLLLPRTQARELLLLFGALAILGLTPINTDIAPAHMLVMGLTLTAALALPWAVARFVYHDPIVRFPWHHGRRWTGVEVGYIAFTAVLSYLILPFYLRESGAYLHWAVEPGAANVGRLFLGTNALGIWDELFFVSTCLGILRRHLPFWGANLAQGVLFTSFLFELGFTGWGPVLIFPFALLQGLVFRKTESLLYVIAIHLALDLVLFLVLLELHHPGWAPIFLT